MPKITLKPTNQILEVNSKKTLLEQLNKNDIILNSSCGGFGTCGDCVVKIVKGEDQCSPPTYEEIKLLGNVFHLTHERLSCQLKILGDVEVDISTHLNTRHKKQPKPKENLKTMRRKSSSIPVKTEVQEVKTETVPVKEKEGGLKRPMRKKF